LLRCAAASAIWRYNSYIPSPFIGSTNNSVNAHTKASQNRRASGRIVKTTSWLNAVESFFSKMTRQRIRRGVFHSIVDLQTAINAYLAEHNASPKQFVWTKSADAVLAKLDRLPVLSV
jgi:hypothetical protein